MFNTRPSRRGTANGPSKQTIVITLGILFLLSAPLFAQQTYVTRFDAYGGYAFLDSPRIGLFEHGFSTQVGFRPRTWYSFGFDYTFAQGPLTLTPDLLPADKQATLAGLFGQLAATHQLPPGYSLVIPADSRTQTFAVGPQLAYRHFEKATLFLRPVFAGAIHETATPNPGDAIAKLVVSQLAPAGKKTDTAGFVGFGGGFDVIFSKHFSVRTQADLVYDHLFNDILKDGRWTTRFSVGPAFNFGKNIASTK